MFATCRNPAQAIALTFSPEGRCLQALVSSAIVPQHLPRIATFASYCLALLRPMSLRRAGTAQPDGARRKYRRNIPSSRTGRPSRKSQFCSLRRKGHRPGPGDKRKIRRGQLSLFGNRTSSCALDDCIEMLMHIPMRHPHRQECTEWPGEMHHDPSTLQETVFPAVIVVTDDGGWLQEMTADTLSAVSGSRIRQCGFGS